MQNFKEKVIELKTAVNESAQLTKNQLDAIKFQKPLTIIISFAISLGLVYWIKVAIYWIPASFLIMYLWGLKGLLSSKKSFDITNVERSIEVKKKLTKEQLEHGVEWFFLNISSFAKATAIIYGISLFILLAIHQGWIAYEQKPPLFWPIISLIIYLPIPFLLKRTSIFIKRFIHAPFELLETIKDVFGSGTLSIILGILKMVFILIVILGSLLAPIISLIQTLGLIQDWLFFGLVVMLQFSLIIILSGYYSSITALSQLANTLTNYADINYQLNKLLLDRKVDEIKLNQLKKLYLTAKPYDLLIDNSMQFVQFYYLLMNKTYLSSLSEMTPKTENDLSLP